MSIDTIVQVELEQVTIVHVEDEESYEFALRQVLRSKAIGYLRISLLSDAGYYIQNRLVTGFIIDLSLPTESPSAFEDWGDFARTSLGLIERIRRERSDIPVVVLTNYDDPGLNALVEKGLLSREDIFRKMKHTEETKIEELVARLRPKDEIPADLDPDLQYLLAAAQRGYRPRPTSSTEEGEVAVLAQVKDIRAWQRLEGVRPGVAIPSGEEWIVTGRVRIDQVIAVHRQAFVRSLDAARRLQPVEETLPEIEPAQAGFVPSRQTGGGAVVVGIIDSGCDFAHSRFRKEGGSTRLLALWDQNGAHEGPCSFGALYDAERIDRALKTEDPYSSLNYHPEGPGNKPAHGTHVMDIAAGRGTGGWKSGLAPDADLVFVELSTADVPWENPGALAHSLGDSVHFVEALSFIFRTAGGRPCVVNASLGLNTGPHDGSTLVERSIDALVAAAPNRVVVLSAGNRHDRGLHARGSVPQGSHVDLRWKIGSRNELNLNFKLELWYSGQDVFSVELLRPSGQRLCRVRLGNTEKDPSGVGLPGFHLTHKHTKSNDSNLAALLLGPDAEPGEWRLRLIGERVSDGSFHAWIESVLNRPASFVSPDVTCTLSALACGHQSVVVGSCAGHSEACACSHFSGSGPTRDGRQKPDLCAPGEAIVAAASCSPGPVAMTGTSMAAPAVAGHIASLLGEAHARSQALTVTEIREILHSMAKKQPHAIWNGRLGWGCLH